MKNKQDLEKIISFLDEHHVMSLATSDGDMLSVCNLFYAYSKDMNSFVVASSDDTKHIQDINKNASIAGSVVLETKELGKIQGLQFRGNFLPLDDSSLKKLYYKAFPYALAMNPKLWQIKLEYLKMTDNKLGFGKKIIWKDN